MSDLSIFYKFTTGQFDEAVREIYTPIAKAGTSAMREAIDTAKERARDNIRAAGFTDKWAKTLRGETFPKDRSKYSANAAGLVYSKIGYSAVFEEGATIRGKPHLFVPLRNTPKKVRGKRMTPRLFNKTFGRLYRVDGKSGPLLVAPVTLSKSGAKKGPPYKVTQSALRKGAAGEGIVRTVPLFVGIDRAKISKQFDVIGEVQKAADSLPQLYLKHLEPDA